ncbi:laminin subunit alpha-5 [Aplochiton taeniatus]
MGCKNNIIGRQCDRCEPGFYGYPNCRPCDCNEAGTEKNVCDFHTGQCLCKENVQGLLCDQCRVGTFHLDPINPKGCTSCFCFGATDRCRSSEKRRITTMDMLGWVLLGAERQEVPVTEYPGQDLVEADLSDVPDVYQDLHWHAPRTYLGDKVSSYGGYMRYSLHTQIMRGDILSLPAEASRPDVILKGNQMTLVFMEREYFSPDESHLGIVHMVEGSFRHAQTGNMVSREELMMVLVALESLQIRALHSQSAYSVSISAVVLEGSKDLPVGHRAKNVEICMCPANYIGDSCQKCAPGYYRDTKGLFLGKCVACNCNGHSDQCLDGTGSCVNCQHNMAGDHCENCRGGFHGNNIHNGQLVRCNSCPCPLQVASNNFAVNCVEKPNKMQCLCMPGYAGPNCERCAPGFYGNPMVIGSTCQPCNCNDNTDTNMLFSDCHPLTGECHGCMHNTAGAHCEICTPGFYGDAIIARNCSRCNCFNCGTSSCNPQTGQCQCKPGVVGPLCDRCEGGWFGYDSCSGCRRCDCMASAALAQSCDPQSGQCSCQPGVNGPNCQQCAPGFWDYSPNGCRKCDCKGGRCDPRTGQCRCADGVTGNQCNTCYDRYNIPVQHEHSVFCEACDSCVIFLLEDLDSMNNNFHSVANQLTNLNATSITWVQLQNLNHSMEDITYAIENYNSTLDVSHIRTGMLEAEITNINTVIHELGDKLGATCDKANNLEESINNTQQRLQDLMVFIKNIIADFDELVLSSNHSLDNEMEQEHNEEEKKRKRKEVEAMLRDMRFRSCVGQKTFADRELSEAEKLLERVKAEIVSRQRDNEGLSLGTRDRLSRFHLQLMDLRDALNEAVSNTAHTSETNNVNELTLEESRKKIYDLKLQQRGMGDLLKMAEDDVAQVNDMLTILHNSQEEYERLAAQLDGARKLLADKVQDFAPVVSKIPLVEEAEKHTELLSYLAMNLSSLITGTEDGFIGRALNASRAYTNIIDIVGEAEAAANQASQDAIDTLEAMQEGRESIGNPGRGDAVVELKNAQSRFDKSDIKHRFLLKDLELFQDNLNISREGTVRDIEEAKHAAEQANTTASYVHDTLEPIRERLSQWEQTYSVSNTTNDDINKALMEANKTVSLLGEAIPLLMKKLDYLQNKSALMPNISENILRIRKLIEEARKAANKVSVPVKFNGTAGIQVRTPRNLADLAAYTSLKFYITLPEATRIRRQDESTKQFVFYLGNKNSSQEFLGMALEGRRLRWFFNLGGDTAIVPMQEDVLADGKFNNVVLERILQYGQMAMSSETSERRVTKADVEAGGDKGLLNLQSDQTVFYVGGYPSTFAPPSVLAFPNFKGCIELETLNEEVLSLYNFENLFHLNTTEEKPCGRAKPVLTQQWVNDGAYFDGTGYAEITFKEEAAKMQRYEQEVKLLSQNGILLLLHGQDHFLCLAVQQGHLKVYYNFNGTFLELDPKDPTSPHLRISDADPKALELIILRSTTYRVVVRNNRNNLYNYQFSEEIPMFIDSYFLGGVPQNKMPANLKALFPLQGSLKGCFRNVKAMNSYIDLKRMTSSGVSYGCANDLLVAREAHFSGESYLYLLPANIPSLRTNFYSGFGFRTSQRNGLMFYYQAQDGVLLVFLDKGHVVVRAGNNEIRSQKTYNDDSSHYISLYSNTNGLRLYMDDLLEKSDEGGQGPSNRASNVHSGVYLGGMPDGGGLSNLTGCISNLFIKSDQSTQMVLNLVKVEENINVPLKCPAPKKPLQILATPQKNKSPKGTQRKSQRGSGSRSRSARDSCQGELSTQEPRATHYSGSSHSYQIYDRTPQTFRTTSYISMSLRVNSSDGLVLFVPGEHDNAMMSLSISEGHFLLVLKGGGRKVGLRSRTKYNDDLWHSVFIKQEGDKASLIVDGINVQTKRVAGRQRSQLSLLLYIGGVPSSLKVAADSSGFVGCMKDLKLNEEPAGNPSHSQGTVPCFQDSLLPGAYFSVQGGHMAIDVSLDLDWDLEIKLEVRPISDSGLLLHAGTTMENYLSLYLNQGKVIYQPVKSSALLTLKM